MNEEIIRFIETDEGQFHFCSREQDYRPINLFQRDRSTTTGFRYICRECLGIGNTDERKIFDAKKYSDEILFDLGYDLNSSIPVHKQFHLRHNL